MVEAFGILLDVAIAALSNKANVKYKPEVDA